jgi:hypothetical protein
MQLFKLTYSISYLLSGFVFLGTLLGLYKGWDFHEILKTFSNHANAVGIVGPIGFVLCYISGLLFDTLRYLIENFINPQLRKEWHINNEYFFYCKDDCEVAELNNDYYDYFVLDGNLSLAFITSFLIVAIHNIKFPQSHHLPWILLLLIGLMLLVESIVLWRKIASKTQGEWKKIPGLH